MVQDAAYCLAKVGVAGSNPVVRSKDSQVKRGDESAATSTNVRYWSAIAATSAASSSPASVRGSVRVGTHSDNELGVLLSALEPLGRDALRRVLIQDQPTATRSPRSCSATATGEATTGPTSSTC
jgi:hypothetical protein